MPSFKQYLGNDLKDDRSRDCVRIELGNFEEYIKDERLIHDMPEMLLSFRVDRQRVVGMDKGKVPKIITGVFSMYGTGLTSLENGPVEAKRYHANYNSISSLEYGPMKCEGFQAFNNDLISLEGIGRKYLKECKELDVGFNPFKSNLLGVFLVKGLDSLTLFQPSDVNGFVVELKKVCRIIYDHFEEKDLLECQEELISKGYKDYAKL